MDLDEAKKMVSTPEAVLSETRARLAEVHAEAPQRRMLADAAMAEVEAALARLASLGHRFVLVEAPDTAGGDEYPKMLYRDGPGGGESSTADSKAEEASLVKDGWRTSPAPSGAKSATSTGART